jgi:hypothetical protein
MTVEESLEKARLQITGNKTEQGKLCAAILFGAAMIAKAIQTESEKKDIRHELVQDEGWKRHNKLIDAIHQNGL